jgi:hypothetical protein
MKIMKSKFGTLMGSCLALSTLVFAPIAQSQSNASPQAQRPSAVASMETRSAFATRVEHTLRQRGLDARVQLDGDRRDVLRIEWLGARRSDIYQFVNSSAAHSARQMGFSSFVFTNGNLRWDYELARESMVWGPAQL